MKELADAKKKIDESIEFIKWKQGFYDDVLSGKVQYFSYLKRDDKNQYLLMTYKKKFDKLNDRRRNVNGINKMS